MLNLLVIFHMIKKFSFHTQFGSRGSIHDYGSDVDLDPLVFIFMNKLSNIFRNETKNFYCQQFNESASPKTDLNLESRSSLQKK